MDESIGPELIIETSVPMSDRDKKQWFRDRQAEGTAKGMQWHRFVHHPTDRNRVLYEGWKVRPDEKGLPHWSEDE